MWRNSFKKLLGLPTNLPHETLDKIFTSAIQISDKANLNTRGRIKNRFCSAEEEDSAIIEGGGENYEEKKKENI
jgi:hypothetical protein